MLMIPRFKCESVFLVSLFICSGPLESLTLHVPVSIAILVCWETTRKMEIIICCYFVFSFKLF